MAIYMKYGDIQGDVQESNHVNWVELSSLSWGVVRPASNPAAATAGRVLAAPRVSDLTVGKNQDVASIPLAREALEGQPAAVQIDFVRTSDAALTIYYTIRLQNAVITAFAQSGTSDRPSETLTLNFTTLSLEGTQMAADGSAASPASYGWDVANNQST